MRTIRVLSTLLIFSLLLPVAFGGAAAAAPAIPAAGADYRDVFIKASQNLLNLKSYRLTMAAEGSMVMDGKTMGFVAGGQSDVQLKPLLMKNALTATMDTGGKKSVYTLAQYVEETGGKLVVYSHADNRWTRQMVSNLGGNYGDYRKYLDGFIKGITGVKLVRETDDALVLEAAVSAGCLQEGLEQAMASVTGRKAKLPESLFDEVGDFRYTAVIAKNNLQISELSLNMAEFVNSVAQVIIDNLNLPEDQKALTGEILRSVKLQVKLSLSRYNANEPITIPREATDAPLVAPPAKPEPPQDGKSDGE